MLKQLSIALALPLRLGLAACDPEIEGGDDAGTAPDAGAATAVCTEPTAVPCEDQLYLQLSLHDFISSGLVTDSESGGVHTALIDATAGGMSGAPSQPYLYLKFTDDGLVKQQLSDDDALTSMDWHLAAKRYVVMVNSGDFGPSCVGATQVSGELEAVTSAPGGDVYELEDFFTDGCVYVPDERYASGGFDSPNSVLREWWEFGNCVSTSGQVFVLQLEDGRHVKLVFDAYYESGQDDCNDLGVMGSGSGMLTMRWAWL